MFKNVFAKILFLSTASSALAAAEVSEQIQQKQFTKVVGATLILDESGKQIPGLLFDLSDLPVSMLKVGEKVRPYVKISGQYNGAGELFVRQAAKNEKVVPNQKNRFEVYALLKSERSHVEFVLRQADGTLVEQRIVIFSPSAQEFVIATNIGEFWVGVGGGSFSYFQTGFGNFASKNAVQQLGYRSPTLYRRFGLKSAFRSPVWTVSSAPINASPDLLNGELDLFYVGASSVNITYKSVVSVGISYFTLLTYGAPFGFSNLFIPSVGYEFHKKRNRYDSYVFSAKYMPIGGLLSSEYGLDLRIGYRMKLINFHALQVDLSWVRLAYVPLENAEIRAKFLSLVASYQF